MVCGLLRQFMSTLSLVVLVSSENPIARPGCSESCGSSKIPFPFGIGLGCYHDPWYEIVCSRDIPILRTLNLTVLNISSCLTSLDSESTTCRATDLKLQVITDGQTNFVKHFGNSDSQATFFADSIDLAGSPFGFSLDEHVFLVSGCPGLVTIRDENGYVMGGCFSVCEADNMAAADSEMDSYCDGLGCCLIFPSSSYKQIESYQIRVTNTSANTEGMMVRLTRLSLPNEYYIPYYSELYWKPPVLSDYRNTRVSCDKDCILSKQSCDTDTDTDIVVVCTCSSYHQGNPYLPYGCQAGHLDSCKGGGDHFPHCMEYTKAAILLGFTLCFGAILLLLGCFGLYCLVKRRRQIKHRAKFLKRIGGQQLDQKMTSPEGLVKRTTLFTATELEKATDGFNDNRILGRGGQGTVYKGMLPDGSVVAIKKSRMIEESHLDQFINEVVILSQLNHRNVVKLLGCCLEMEVPLLVYEFVPNGTLSQHIQNPNKDFPITWRTRLRIAAESAAAIAYLHSSSSMPIYHRDIKSSNILLDERYRAKVSDFGISRTILIDQTHLTTCVQGTFGYLDPEYCRSNQFTEKSDVYSFGVVLAELLTSKKPLSPPDESGGWKNLAMEFLLHMENCSLFDLVDARVLEEAKEEELLAVANVTMWCLNLNGKQRPTMKEVASALEGIRSPNLPSTTEQNHLKGNDVVMEMSNISSDYMSSSSFFYSENGIGGPCSVETQPLKHNTI